MGQNKLSIKSNYNSLVQFFGFIGGFIWVSDHCGAGGGRGGAPQGKKLFEVDTQGEKGRHLWGEHFFSFLFSKITPWWKGRRENILAAEGGRLIF